MYNINNNKQLNKMSNMSLGSQKMAHSPFSLVHLILCYTTIE